MTGIPLKRLASIRVSNVDKKSVAGQVPVRLCNYTDVYYRSSISPDQEFMAATASPDQVVAFRLQVGDVIITKDSETAEDIGIPTYVRATAPDLVCGYHLALVRPDSSLLDGKFLYWFLSSRTAQQQLSVAATGVTRFGLRSESTGGVVVPDLPLRRQRAIANYLDAETGRIDAIVGKKRQLLALLDEHVEAVAAEVLSSKDTVPLRRVAELLAGFTFASSDFSATAEGPRLLRGVNVGLGAIRWNDTVRFAGNVGLVHEYALRVNDIVLGMDRPFIGGGTRVAVVNEKDEGALLVQRVCRIRCSSPEQTTLVRWALASRRFRAHVEPDLSGVSVPHLSETQIGSFPVPEIPPSELVVRASKIERAEARALAIRERLSLQLDRLLEHRQALITAAVAGELEIPGAA